MKRSTLLLVVSATMLAAACKKPAPAPKAPPAPVPAKPVPPPRAVDGGAAIDARPLGMMERHAIWKAKRDADAKLAAENAAAEKARLIKFDKSKMSKHLALFAFEKKTRATFDKAAEKLNGKIDAADQLKKIAVAQQKAINAQIGALRAMDPKGGNSNIGTDHDVVLNLLATDYPAAIVSFFQGQTKPLAEIRAELDKREKKIGSWLAEVKSSK